ncbi:MAG: MFS transporter [Chloroflexota bacterium]|nr:MFS transporter [Chloroflexota bacterium]
MKAVAGTYVHLLRRNPAFARLYAAQLISFGGDWFATVALLGLALELTGSEALASLILVLQVAPFFVLSPLAGVLADRVDRRRLMIAADLGRAVVALGFLLGRDPSTLWICFVAVALLSAGTAFFEPTASASLPNLVEKPDLPRANVLVGSAWGTMLAVGSGIGGVVAAVLGRDAAFILNAASFLVSGVLILGIRRPFSQRSGSRSPGSDAAAARAPGVAAAIGEAVAVSRSSRFVAALLFSKGTFGVGVGVVLFLAVFGREVFGAGDPGIGLLFAARGVGVVIGPFLAQSVIALDDRGLLSGIATSLVGFLVCYLLFPLAPSIWVAALLVLGAHLGGGAQWTLSTYGLQRAVADELRGRIFSFDYALVTLTEAVSIVAAGMLAAALGPRPAIYVVLGAAAVASAGWILYTRPLRRVATTGPAEDVVAGPS